MQLVRQAVGMGRRAYVLVNNRAEGNAPLTVEGLAELLRTRSSCRSLSEPVGGLRKSFLFGPG